MANFRRKIFSYVISDTIKGASYGAGLSTLVLPFMKDSELATMNAEDKFTRNSKVIAVGMLVGAALGALVGLIKEGESKVQRSRVDNRLMRTVIDGLKGQGFVEGESFTRDPKKATDLKTRVCIVITKVSGEFNLLVNTVQDGKLESITKEMIKNLPNLGTVTEKVSDRYNDITISSISDSSVTAGLVIGICERFIRAGFPVYLVEVG